MRSLFVHMVAVVLTALMVGCSGAKNENIAEIKLTSDSLVNLNVGWGYLEQNLEYEDVKSAAFLDSVNLPHCWNSVDAVDATPGYRRDRSWYKKTLNVTHLADNLDYLLVFEGANLKTNVYVNGSSCGGHVGGYVGFEVDISERLKVGKNEILVSVDNAVDRELVPSQKSDFFIYGGITRDVWLKMKPKKSFSAFYPVIKHLGNQDFSVEVTLSGQITNAELLLEVRDGDEVISSTWSKKAPVVLNNVRIEELWSIDNPKLYDLVLTQFDGEDVLYTSSKKIGFRYSEFKEGGGYYLNGQQVLIRGTHRHEEHAGVAAAMSNEMHYNDIKMIKDMGANFVRLAHYPQDPEVYKACDELGVLVWDEVPWCRGGVGNEQWKANTSRLLEEQIKQNMHHASIITWSMGNEVYWDADFEGGGDIPVLRAYLKELCDLSKKIDPTRPTSIRKFYEGADIVDVFSPSIWAGWYRGKYGEYEDALEDSRKKYPRFIHMEYGCASHLGRHDENEQSVDVDGGWEEDPSKIGVNNMAQNGTWSETYAVDLFDWHLHVSEHLQNFSGNAQWAFKDFGTPLRPENPVPYINQKGIMDRAGRPKDAYYVFRSYWDKNNPFAYIQSHTWTDRFGKEGQTKVLRVYSNCDSVQFSLNGEKLGLKIRNENAFPAHGFYWDVQFKTGTNNLVATAWKDGEMIADEMTVNYRTTIPEKPVELTLTVEPQGGLYKVTASAVDENGVICQDYKSRVYFDVNGGAELLDDLGTNDGSSIIEPMNGVVVIYVKPGKSDAQLEVRNQDFKGTYALIPKY